MINFASKVVLKKKAHRLVSLWLHRWDLKRAGKRLSAIRRSGTTNYAMSDPDSTRHQRFFKGLDLQSAIFGEYGLIRPRARAHRA